MRKACAALLVFALSGCAGVNRSLEYNSVKYVVFSDPALPHAFWIFDKPEEGRMLVNTAPGAAAGQGFAKGITLGLAQTATPADKFRAAAELFLAKSARSCSLASVKRVLGPTNYEAKYVCA